jgi:hypothetical protein
VSKRLPGLDALTLVQDVPPPQADKVFLIAADLTAYQRWHAQGEAVGWDEPKHGPPALGDLVVDVCRATGARFVAGWSTAAVYAQDVWTYDHWQQSPPILLADVLEAAGLGARLPLPAILLGSRAWQFTKALATLHASPPPINGQEGRQIERRMRERSAMLRAAKLLSHGTVCAACETDYGQRAGGLGVHALDVHHLEALSKRGAGTTRLDELAVVCASCHRMLHGDGGSTMLTPDELRGRLRPPSR